MTNASTPRQSAPKNHLAGEKSPYLLQHAGNPVDWYPWGDEAFARAATESKPIFLSIGYATCHWCHVMERESFADEAVARQMNETFINIKVDREERPDIDQVYMTVCQMMTGGGGWPLTIIMTPDRQPFFAATYIPRESRFGRIGMLELVPRVRELWQTDRARAHASARQILDHLRQQDRPQDPGALDAAAVGAAFDQLAARYDPVNGGFGDAPKFPSPHNLVFLTRFWRSTGNQRALEMVEHTLERMRLGGIYDHIGFGFHRYSTDAEWLVPHFEKMLYDQAMLLASYTEAWQATSNPLFERTVREIVTYVVRDMTSPEGAFFSAEDADSEGEEGRFYLWTTDETREVLRAQDATFAADLWNMSADGNYTDEIVGGRTGRNILHREVSGRGSSNPSIPPDDMFDARLENIRAQLFAVRDRRLHPLKDDKVLADWNGLMAAALARAGSVFGEPEWIRAAERAVAFVTDTVTTASGRLLHRYRDGEAAVPAFLDDHVFLTTAMLELYDATFDPDYLARALALQETTVELFWDDERGGFFYAAGDNEDLLVRQKEIYDGAIPSGNSTAADNLVRLAHLTGVVEHLDRAHQLFAAFAADATRLPSAHTQLMSAFLRASGTSVEVVVAGAPEAADTTELLAVLKDSYRPHMAVVLAPPGAAGNVLRELAPFTANHLPVDGKAAAYVCRDFSCRLPTTDPEELAELLDEVEPASDG